MSYKDSWVSKEARRILLVRKQVDDYKRPNPYKERYEKRIDTIASYLSPHIVQDIAENGIHRASKTMEEADEANAEVDNIITKLLRDREYIY